MELIIKELHNSSASASSGSGVLSPYDNTLYYNEKAAITSGTYKKIFKCPSQCRRRLAILKITFEDDSCRKHTVWRAANTKGVTDINDDSIGLPFDAIWELNAVKANRSGNDARVEVTKGGWLPFFLFHPNHAARISTRIGLFSILLSVAAIVISIIQLM